MSKVFPKSANTLPLKIAVFLVVFAGTVLAGVNYYATPKYTRVGYAPVQPVPFEHSLHAGQLGIDCRYCHTHVEESDHSNVPATHTCMACHSIIKTRSPLLAPVRASYETGEPVPWVRIHKAPDYVYFSHQVHVNRGISCYECHGQVNEMPVMFQAHAQSMGWCLDCHRAPEKQIRPLDEVFNLDWHASSPEAQLEQGRELVAKWNVDPPQSCSGCHR
ncbi:MAG: cytochrome c3 family protein [Opitutaceae bacterium]